MRLLPWLVVLGLACAPAAEEPGPSVVQQAVLPPLDPNPAATGNNGDELGTSLAACPSAIPPVMVAGALGLSGAWKSTTGSMLRAADAGFGAVVACEGADGVVVGGPGGLLRFNGTAWITIDTGHPYTAVASGPGVPTIGAGGSTTFAFSTPMAVSFKNIAGASDVRALSWLSGSAFAVGSVGNGAVLIYDWDGGFPTARQTISGGSAVGFGRALAFGDVTPANPGRELIIGAEGQVFIYSLGGTHLNTLTGTPTFGTSLAIEPSVFPQLDALWVGEPGANTVHRFIGDAGEPLPFAGVGPVSFGQSLAISGGGQLSIGAPGYPDAQKKGAVFTYTPARSTLVAQVQVCGTQNSACPNINCTASTCLGGVACVAPLVLDPCPAGMQCMGNVCKVVAIGVDAGMQVDAGEIIDAGVSTDAGVSIDAGVTIDAGVSIDAGLITDAGVSTDAGLPPGDAGGEPERIQFTSCGCSGGAAVPTLMLGLLLTRRWRRRSHD